MDREQIRIKQLSLKIFEEILLEKEYKSRNEVLLNAVSKTKALKQRNAPKEIVSAYSETVKMLSTVTFEEMKELITLLKGSKI